MTGVHSVLPSKDRKLVSLLLCCNRNIKVLFDTTDLIPNTFHCIAKGECVYDWTISINANLPKLQSDKVTHMWATSKVAEALMLL